MSVSTITKCKCMPSIMGFPGGSVVKSLPANAGDQGSIPGPGRSSGEWQPTLVFLPGKSHGQGSLAGYCPWGRRELNMTEHAHRPFQSQRSCLWLWIGIWVEPWNQLQSTKGAVEMGKVVTFISRAENPGHPPGGLWEGSEYGWVGSYCSWTKWSATSEFATPNS